MILIGWKSYLRNWFWFDFKSYLKWFCNSLLFYIFQNKKCLKFCFRIPLDLASFKNKWRADRKTNVWKSEVQVNHHWMSWDRENWYILHFCPRNWNDKWKFVVYALVSKADLWTLKQPRRSIFFKEMDSKLPSHCKLSLVFLWIGQIVLFQIRVCVHTSN